MSGGWVDCGGFVTLSGGLVGPGVVGGLVDTGGFVTLSGGLVGPSVVGTGGLVHSGGFVTLSNGRVGPGVVGSGGPVDSGGFARSTCAAASCFASSQRHPTAPVGNWVHTTASSAVEWCWAGIAAACIAAPNRSSNNIPDVRDSQDWPADRLPSR